MCVVGPITAVTRAPMDVCFDTPETKEMLLAAALEVARVGEAHGCKISGDADLEEYIIRKYEALENTFKRNPGTTVSTTRDILTGKPSELDALTGGILHLAARNGVPTPVNKIIYAILRPQERRARQDVNYTLVGIPGG